MVRENDISNELLSAYSLSTVKSWMNFYLVFKFRPNSISLIYSKGILNNLGTILLKYDEVLSVYSSFGYFIRHRLRRFSPFYGISSAFLPESPSLQRNIVQSMEL